MNSTSATCFPVWCMICFLHLHVTHARTHLSCMYTSPTPYMSLISVHAIHACMCLRYQYTSPMSLHVTHACMCHRYQCTSPTSLHVTHACTRLTCLYTSLIRVHARTHNYCPHSHSCLYMSLMCAVLRCLT